MASVSVRDLRNDGGRVLDRVAAGESLTVTRDGEPVAELRPLLRSPLGSAALLARWRTVPAVDPAAFRRDVDALVDQNL
jgi:prevent-host-death family protein